MANAPHGPASYFPAIEAKYGRGVDEWLTLLDVAEPTGHTALVAWLKAEHGLGHGHANALVQYHLHPEKWARD
ncbi:hypothetical protein BOX37_24685 [Nocardia mangyaensis]|uniref:DUF4287 domain-containing protein n=1 Tax=Nocardia mangyaensis TaxID=2213200 RepID=A0A1J0VX54_9NOCA|nr:DUF4287 domain-containing protein [Nocardia mangyaensis]APE36593.1 hypothetical protein BOX37_24685 [Nocardia mangyaensis]